MNAHTTRPLWRELLRLPLLVVAVIGAIAASIPALLYQERLGDHLLEMVAEHESRQLEDNLRDANRVLASAEASATRFAALVSSNPPRTPGDLEQRLVRDPDGVWRTPRQHFDATRQAGAWIPPSTPLDDATRQLFLNALDVTTLYGQGALNPVYEDTWVLPRTNGEIIYFPSSPDFIYQSTPDSDYRNSEWMTLTDPARNPQHTPRWTPITWDPVARSWMVSVVAPFFIDGEWAGAVGHDILLDSLLHALQPSRHAADADMVWMADGAGKVIPLMPGSRQIRGNRPIGLSPALRDELTGMMTNASSQPIAVRQHTDNDGLLMLAAVPSLNLAVAYRVDRQRLMGLIANDFLSLQISQGLALMAMVLGIGALSLQALRQRHLRLQAIEIKNGELEALVAQRTHALQEANVQLELQNRRDPLTGLNNRRHFEEALAHVWAICCRREEPMTVMMIDIDYFKAYNDTYGHQAGDSTLQAVAHVVGSRSQRVGDMAVRFGGEEFALILPATGGDAAMMIAHRMREDLARRAIPHTGSPLGHITVSIGIASERPQRGMTPDVAACALVQRADQALYAAKNGGRDRAMLAMPDSLDAMGA